jgi:Peptidase family M1 domain
MRQTAVSAALLASSVLVASAAAGQAPTPDSLARLVVGRFAEATPAAFDSVDPDPLGRALIRSAIDRHLVRGRGLTRVLAADPQQAILLLTATVGEPGSATGVSTGGDQTNRVRRFSGLYTAVRTGDAWTLARRVPFDSANWIRAQHLHVALAPGQATHVLDTLDIAVGAPFGFGVRLNTAAQLATVLVDGHPAHYDVGGGVLWIQPVARGRRQLVFDFTLPPERDSTHAADSAIAHGALHNTDAWHPFFDYDSGHDLATMSITATIPAVYRLTTTIPQTESVQDSVRTVRGATRYPQFLLGLIYDRDWRPVVRTLGDIRLETFTTPTFPFTIDTMGTVVAREYRVLSGRFGEPRDFTRYFAVVEDRDRELHGAGFTVRINDAVVSGDHATMMDETALGPSYVFAHEVSHAWTMNASGPAANMLREGWARFSETVMLGNVYGPDVAQRFWERMATSYFAGNRFEGKQSILGDPDNGNIHYTKGSWIFHMLDRTLGDSVFDQGMRTFITNCGHGPDGYQELIADMSHAAGRDLTGFIMPWPTERYVPDVDARVDGSHLIVTQRQPGALFDLPLQVALQVPTGEVRRPVHLATRADTLDIGDLGPVAAVRVDPDHDFLMRRHWGELARFELVAPDAKTVALALSTGAPAPATRDGDRWVVTLPLAEGRYVYLWNVDGKAPSDDATLAAVRSGGTDPAARAGVKIVHPLQRLEESDAK